MVRYNFIGSWHLKAPLLYHLHETNKEHKNAAKIVMWDNLGAQKNCLIETVLFITHNICFGWEIQKKKLLHTLN